MSAQPVDVLLRIDVLIHTLPILVADANKAGANASADKTIAELRDLRDAVAELMALLRAMVETDRLVGREDIANLFWPVFIKDARTALARVQGVQA